MPNRKKTNSNKKNKIIYKLTAAAVCIVLSAVAIACVCVKAQLISFNKMQMQSEGYSVGSISENSSVKHLPYTLSLPEETVEKGCAVKVLAQNEKWSKIVYNSNGALKCGFIKTELIENMQPESVKAEALTFDTGNLTARVGETVDVNARLYPKNANEQIFWSSSDESVASVENGKVTLNKCGTAVITAKTENCSQSIDIRVIDESFEISFKKASYSLDLGSSLKLNSEINCDCKNIDWETSNADIIAVENGKATAKAAGAVVITAKINGAEASCRVYVRNANQHAPRPLNTMNAYGNIYNYHPSVYYFEGGWNGYKYWCAYTPYEKNNDYWENPHIEVSNDLKNWTVPKGFSNPLEPVPETYERGKVYNSDTELVYNTDTKQLECWWRFYDKPNNRVVLRRKVTKDGTNWSKAEDMLTGELYKYDFLSPAIIYENGIYRMWAINQNTGHSLDYRESADGRNWGEIRQIRIEYKDKELANWHIDLIHTPKGYEALISAYYPKENDRTHMSLYYAYSADNISYTKAEKIFSPSDSDSAFDNRGLYRSSLFYANGKYYMIYSALNKKTGPSGMGIICGKNVFTMH